MHVFFSSILVPAVFNGGCEQDQAEPAHSGIYCLNIQNIEMILSQGGKELSFTIQKDLLVDGTGTISGDTVILKALTPEDAGRTLSSARKHGTQICFSARTMLF